MSDFTGIREAVRTARKVRIWDETDFQYQDLWVVVTDVADDDAFSRDSLLLAHRPPLIIVTDEERFT